MIIKALLLVCVSSLVTPVLANGSKVSFARTYGGPSGFEATSIRQTSDSGFIIAGLADNVGVQKQTWLLRLDRSGLLLWQKAYGGVDVSADGSIAGFQGPAAENSVDGGFVIASSTTVSSHVAAWIFKVDSSGNLVWQEMFTGDGAASSRSIDAASDGGYVVVAATVSTNVTFAETRTLVMRLDGNGGVIWQHIYNGSGVTAAPDSVTHTSDGGFVVVGQTFPADPWMLRLDSTGRVVWERVWEAGLGSELKSVQETSDLGLIAAGGLWSFGPYSNNKTMIVLKLDQLGNVTWMKSYGGAGFLAEATAVQQTPDGGYVVVGSRGSFRPFLTSAVLIRLDDHGNILWQKDFETSSQFSIGANAVVQTPNGRLVSAGTMYPTFGTSLGAQAWVTKLNANGKAGGCSSITEASLVATNTSLRMIAFQGTSIDVTSGPISTSYVSESASATASTICN